MSQLKALIPSTVLKNLQRFGIPAFLTIAVVASLLILSFTPKTMFDTKYAFGYGYDPIGPGGGGGSPTVDGTTLVYDVIKDNGQFSPSCRG